jgi:hypothetical protein
MTVNTNNAKKVIFDIYNKGYYDKYGGSFLLVFLVVILISSMLYYSYFMDNIDYIRDNWGTERCKPYNMPFVGEAFPPSDGSSKFSFIAENFNFCLDSIFTNISSSLTSPLHAISNSLIGVFAAAQMSLNYVWTNLKNIRLKMGSFSLGIFEKIYAMMLEFTRMSYKLNDTVSKVNGFFVSIFHSIMSVYYMLKSFFGSMYQIVQAVALFFIAMAIIFFYIPFGFGLPMAFVMAAIASVATGFMIAFSVAAAPVIDLSKYWIPSVPGFCFSDTTLLKLKDGTRIKMCDIKPDMTLHDGSRVTSTFELPNYTDKLYRINENILVTGEHMMVIDGKFIPVKHTNIEKVKEEYTRNLYCLNTNSKEINIDGFIFSDYDEVSKNEEMILSKNIGEISKENFWKHYEGGFHPEMMIEMEDGTIRKIMDIKLNDTLKGGIKVNGIINGCNRECKKYIRFWDSGNNNIICSENMILKISLGKGRSVMKDMAKNHHTKNYNSTTINLITSSNTIPLGNYLFWDFHNLMENYLE